ncbi:hypothetical protein FACS1894110_11070 [Spirochaetia bacterium]|nr:hypothetical protein FACS1894110_11070 [Spirochaetia bacterium]
MNKFFSITIGLFILILPALSAQEALKSIEEEYYDFLALQGLTERPTLNFRTLSDSVWNVKEGASHPWENQKLGTAFHFFDKLHLKIYGPELFMSFNTAAPYGQNDGALWQGRGFNTSLTAGARFEAYGAELTLKPQLSFSQNWEFDYMTPEGMTGANYAGKAQKYGYFWGTIDAPQRFGDKPFFTFDWGDSEVRYTWKTLTIGFGTQPIWLGPAYLNPILHSNNAPSYPKLDIGLRKQRIVIPKVNWYWGDVEARIWTGYLSESDYFDNNDANDHTMIHGLSFAYSPPGVLSGLTLSVNRIALVPWEWENLIYIFPGAVNADAEGYVSAEDQKISLGVSWVFPKAGLEIYGEIGMDDYISGGLVGYIRDPAWTMVYLSGLKKTIPIVPEKQIFGELFFEANWFDNSLGSGNHSITWYSYYRHGGIQQGYTNGGQWLGNAASPGGNSQSLGFVVYYPQGKSSIMLNRANPDSDFMYHFAYGTRANRAVFNLDLQTSYYISSFLIFGGLTYNLIIGDFYTKENTKIHNFSIQLGVKWTL